MKRQKGIDLGQGLDLDLAREQKLMVAQQWKMEIKTEGTEEIVLKIGGRDHNLVNVNTRYIFLFLLLSLIKFHSNIFQNTPNLNIF